MFDYLMRLDVDRQRKAMDLLRYAASAGPPLWHPDKCQKVTDTDFFEFKPSRSDRIFWMWSLEGAVILFHAFAKQSNHTPLREIRTGRDRAREILRHMQGGAR
ncbi:MAG: type II toxin-antitoxin system RelE/ParE family toxin [Dehalococcoidia bacterium]